MEQSSLQVKHAPGRASVLPPVVGAGRMQFIGSLCGEAGNLVAVPPSTPPPSTPAYLLFRAPPRPLPPLADSASPSSTDENLGPISGPLDAQSPIFLKAEKENQHQSTKVFVGGK